MARASAKSKEQATGRRNLEEVKRPLRAFFKARGLNESKTRDAVIDVFLSAQQHLGLNAILAKVRVTNPGIGLATVYRTMRLLEEGGFVQSRDFGGETLFEVAVGRAHHDHLVCQQCGLIVEFVDESIEKMQEEVAKKHRFELKRHRHDLFGLCATCARRRS